MLFAQKIEALRKEILGKDYELSVAYVSASKSQAINKKYRKKDKSTNVLSFSLSKNSGELIICKAVAKREAKKLDRTFENWLGFLVIHGMLHLKGHVHSSRMERAEKKYDQKYFYRNRYRLDNNTSHSSRVRKGRKKS